MLDGKAAAIGELEPREVSPPFEALIAHADGDAGRRPRTVLDALE
jgi:hypothetical protein